MLLYVLGAILFYNIIWSIYNYDTFRDKCVPMGNLAYLFTFLTYFFLPNDSFGFKDTAQEFSAPNKA